jgi:hypothetical protein
MSIMKKDFVGLVGILLVSSLIFSVFLAYTSLNVYGDITASNNINAIIEVPSTCYEIVAPNVVNFGSGYGPGQTSSAIATTVSDPKGNVDSFPWVSGGSWSIGGSSPTFYVTNTVYGNSIFNTNFIPLTTTSTNTGDMVDPVASITNVISWKVSLPAQQAAGTYNQVITLVGTC